MRAFSIITLLTSLTSAHPSTPHRTPSNPLLSSDASLTSPATNISLPLFASLEELARIVDISYCVGTTGISKPFQCASRCADFLGFELVDTFNTGPLMSDSCGFVVLDHGKEGKGQAGRVIVAFRGTYSIANTIVDLSTVPQEYVPYPGDPEEKEQKTEKIKCSNCTVHSGFWTSWQNTRELVVPHIKAMRKKYPTYRLELVGHSLGGAVAGLAALEFEALGFEPTVTTFGEPKIGNVGLKDYIDGIFNLRSEHGSENVEVALKSGRYRRVTHVDDPVPLLPLQEWGYRAHAGEHFITKASLQPTVSDIRLCDGDEDVNCISAAEVNESWFQTDSVSEVADTYNEADADEKFQIQNEMEKRGGLEKRWGIPIPARYKMWQLFFAHRDYFWRLGLCLPGGDPYDWGRDKYRFGDEEPEMREDL